MLSIVIIPEERCQCIIMLSMVQWTRFMFYRVEITNKNTTRSCNANHLAFGISVDQKIGHLQPFCDDISENTVESFQSCEKETRINVYTYRYHN